MKRITSLIVIATLINLPLSAKLPIGATAPNWTLNDINGNEHTLYNYLDQGYTVILDFSTTWCGPCWDYTNSGALEELYMENGPVGMPNVSANTADKIMIFFIEGDAQTTLDNLNGIGTATLGDYVSATIFPIIDDDSLNDSYEITSWPTVYTICPNKKIINTGRGPAFFLIEYIDDCPVHEIDMRLTSIISNHSFCGSGYDPIVKIQNHSIENILTAATIETSQAGTLLSSYEWSGDLASLESEKVELPSIIDIDSSIPIDFEVIVEDDEAIDNNQVSGIFGLGTYETTNSVTLKLKTDSYPEETTWEIVNYDGELIESGGPYSEAGVYTHIVSLPEEDCYTFFLYDSNGDGMTNGTLIGNYELIDNENNLMVKGYGFFEFQSNQVFNVDLINSVEEIPIKKWSIYPTPSADFVNIDLDLSIPLEDLTIEIVNILGQTVIHKPIGKLDYGSQKINLNLRDLTNGIYIISIANRNKRIAQKLKIQK